MKKLLIAVAALACATSLFAGTQKGNIEVGGAFALTAPVYKGGNEKEVMATLGLGYFVTDAIEVKGAFIGMGTFGGGANEYGFGVLAGPDYHFATTGKLVPYIGAYGGIFFSESTSPDWITGKNKTTSETVGIIDAHVGLKHFVGERTSITYTLSYTHVFVDPDGRGQITAMIGISYLF